MRNRGYCFVAHRYRHGCGKACDLHQVSWFIPKWWKETGAQMRYVQRGLSAAAHAWKASVPGFSK